MSHCCPQLIPLNFPRGDLNQRAAVASGMSYDGENEGGLEHRLQPNPTIRRVIERVRCRRGREEPCSSPPRHAAGRSYSSCPIPREGEAKQPVHPPHPRSHRKTIFRRLDGVERPMDLNSRSSKYRSCTASKPGVRTVTLPAG